MTLNPSAPVFVPTKPMDIPISLPDDPFYEDVAISPEEEEELDMVDWWVNLQASFEEEEGDHLIALAMRFADKGRVHEVKQLAQQAGLTHGHRHKH